jgi:hypothetical protein
MRVANRHIFPASDFPFAILNDGSHNEDKSGTPAFNQESKITSIVKYPLKVPIAHIRGFGHTFDNVAGDPNKHPAGKDNRLIYVYHSENISGYADLATDFSNWIRR